MAVGRWLVAASGTVVLVAWAARRRGGSRQVRAVRCEHRALVNAADWALSRAQVAVGRDPMVLVTVDEVLAKAREDFGLTHVSREHAAAVLRERLVFWAAVSTSSPTPTWITFPPRARRARATGRCGNAADRLGSRPEQDPGPCPDPVHFAMRAGAGRGSVRPWIRSAAECRLGQS